MKMVRGGGRLPFVSGPKPAAPFRWAGPLARSASRVLPRWRGSAVATRTSAGGGGLTNGGESRLALEATGRKGRWWVPAARRSDRDRRATDTVPPRKAQSAGRRGRAQEERARPTHPRWFVFADPQTGVAPGEPEAAMCVQGVDVHCVLQFTLIHAAGCALHRRTSRVIHRSKLYFVFRFTLCAILSRKSYTLQNKKKYAI